MRFSVSRIRLSRITLSRVAVTLFKILLLWVWLLAPVAATSAVAQPQECDQPDHQPRGNRVRERANDDHGPDYDGD